MNEKIQALADELQNECRKEDVALLCTIQKEEKAKSIALGSPADVGFLLAIQEQNLNNDLPTPLTAELLREFGMGTIEIGDEREMNAEHVLVTDDLNDVSDFLKRILRGEL